MKNSRPYPFDSILAGSGFMFPRTRSGEVAYSKRVQVAGSGEERQQLPYKGWPGGFGVRRFDGTEESLKAIYSSEPVDPPVNTGCDTSYGNLILGPKITNELILDGSPVRGFSKFLDKYYATVGNKLYVSLTGEWDDAAVAYTGVGTLRQPTSFAGINSASELLFIPQDNGPYVTYDGTTFQTDAGSTLRDSTAGPTGWFFTQDNGAIYTDGTLTVGDTLTTTAASLDSWDIVANGDWLLVGYRVPFSALSLFFTNFNGTAARVLVGEYRKADGTWGALTLTDGTISGGTTMAQNGVVSWTRPADEWAETTLDGTGQTEAMYFVRFTITGGALDASVDVHTAIVKYAEEAFDFATSSKRLWRLYSGNRVAWTEDGGRTATWNIAYDRLGSLEGDPIGIVAVQGGVFVRRTNGLFGIQPDGTNVQYEPGGMFRTPVSGSDGHGFGAWLGFVYFAHDSGFWQFSPLEGGRLTPVGPERMTVNESAIQSRITALAGDRTHFLYAVARNDQTAESFLLKWGSYQLLRNNETGSMSWVRTDAWHVISHLGDRTIYAIDTYMIGDQPYLVMGDSDGTISVSRLPRAISPLDADSGYRFCSAGAISLPTFGGVDRTLKISAFKFGVNGRQITEDQDIRVYTKDPDASSWQYQGRAVDNGEEVSFNEKFAGYGVDQKIELRTDDETLTPILEQYTLFWQHVSVSERAVYELSVDCSDGVVNYMGTLYDQVTADAWAKKAWGLLSKDKPWEAVLPDGLTDSVLVQSINDSGFTYQERADRKRTVSLVLVSAR